MCTCKILMLNLHVWVMTLVAVYAAVLRCFSAFWQFSNVIYYLLYTKTRTYCDLPFFDFFFLDPCVSWLCPYLIIGMHALKPKLDLALQMWKKTGIALRCACERLALLPMKRAQFNWFRAKITLVLTAKFLKNLAGLSSHFYPCVQTSFAEDEAVYTTQYVSNVH